MMDINYLYFLFFDTRGLFKSKISTSGFWESRRYNDKAFQATKKRKKGILTLYNNPVILERAPSITNARASWTARTNARLCPLRPQYCATDIMP